MAKTKLSAAAGVKLGYAQVEPNHLSAQRTGQIFAQWPADASLDKLENGQFVKYDAANGVVKPDANGSLKGEWYLVFNEIKLYRDHLQDCDFAMKKSDYIGKYYSPVGDLRYGNLVDYSGITTPADPYDPVSTTTPFSIDVSDEPKAMPSGSTMVPRLFKTNVGDIFTTNAVNVAGYLYNVSTGAAGTAAVGDILTIGSDGFLTNVDGATADVQWQVIKVYTLADRQPAVKIIKIK